MPVATDIQELSIISPLRDNLRTQKSSDVDALANNENDNSNNSNVISSPPAMQLPTSSASSPLPSTSTITTPSSPSLPVSPPSGLAPITPFDVDDVKMTPSTTDSNRQTVIIFDWDDTLLASSFLSAQGLRLDTPLPQCVDILSQLRNLEQSVLTCLSTALQHGQVHVITNAETGWVQLSAQKFLPNVVPLLSKVTILSARSMFERHFPEAPLKWKINAFQTRLSESLAETSSCNSMCRNVISFGDSHVEREAVRTVTRDFPNTLTKSVKFAERPSLEQLTRQIELVTNCFGYIISHEGDLDLMLTISLVY